MNDMRHKAERIVEDVLAPAAAEVDRSGIVPAGHFDRLAHDGFYGIVAPPEFGGAGADFGEFVACVEILARGCLATTFTWLQHHGIVMGLAMSPNAALRDAELPRAARGDLRGGAAFSGVLPDPPPVSARRGDGGWTVHGVVPLVSGWGSVHVLHVSGFDPDSGDVVSGLIEARVGDGIVAAQPVDLVAVQGSRTVRLELNGLWLPDDRVTTRVERRQYLAGLVFGLRVDSALALGLVARAAAALTDSGQDGPAQTLGAEADDIRAAFDLAMAAPEQLPGLRARCSELAVRATAASVVAAGGAGVLARHPAQQMAREALFTLVAASRPQVRSALLSVLTRAGDASAARLPEPAFTGALPLGAR